MREVARARFGRDGTSARLVSKPPNATRRATHNRTGHAKGAELCGILCFGTLTKGQVPAGGDRVREIQHPGVIGPAVGT